MKEKYYIGIDVGGTKIFAGLTTAKGKILSTLKKATPAKAKPLVIVNTIIDIIHELLTNAHQSLNDVTAIGIAIPGVVNAQGDIIITPNLSLTKTPLKKILTSKLRKPIAIGNDANLGVLGECWLGAGRNIENMVGIFPGTGIGGGIIINHEFLLGSQGAGAELGHIQIDPTGPKCTCGNMGCLEAFAGRWAIEKQIKKTIKEQKASTILTKLSHKKLHTIKSGLLAKALKAKDPLVTNIMKKASISLAHACVSLNHIFNTDLFIFGGGLIEACGDFILPFIKKALKKDPFFKHFKTPKVVKAQLGDFSVLLGAVALAKKQQTKKLFSE